jgi:transposase InsO family protein
MQSKEESCYIAKIIAEIRADHQTMSFRAMFYKIDPQSMGRDKFEQLCKDLGLKREQKRSGHRTTDSSGVVRFDNLLAGMTLTGINQAWSSDITYFEVCGTFRYITFILDCYSRMVLGYSVSKRLTTEQTTFPSLKMAVKQRGGSLPKGIIFHSDGGGQYYDKNFLAYTQKHQMKNSMCEMAYENGKAERLNGIIKNKYLVFYNIRSFEELCKGVDRAVTLYNDEKPHKALRYKTPSEYEKQLLILAQQTKPTMTGSFDAK